MTTDRKRYRIITDVTEGKPGKPAAVVVSASVEGEMPVILTGVFAERHQLADAAYRTLLTRKPHPVKRPKAADDEDKPEEAETPAGAEIAEAPAADQIGPAGDAPALTPPADLPVIEGDAPAPTEALDRAAAELAEG